MRRWLSTIAGGFISELRSLLARVAGRDAVRAIEAPAWSRVAADDRPPSRLLAEDRVDRATRAGLAAAWRAVGQAAHDETIAASERTIELALLGAPPDLLAATTRSGLDALRRATLCFGLARSLDGGDATLRPSRRARRTTDRPRFEALAVLAAAAVREDALAKSFATRIHAKLSRRATDATVRAALDEASAAESRHVIEAWGVVEWCLAEGGAAVARALADVTLSFTSERTVPRVAREGGWERWGIASDRLERQEITRASSAVDRRLHALLAAARAGDGRRAAA